MAKPDALNIMVTYLGVGSGDAQNEMDDIRWNHARFAFLEKMYIDHLVAEVENDGDDA